MAANDLEKEENKEDDYIKEIKPFLNEKGQLKLFPAKNKKKLYALYYLATKFEMEKQYTEFEINSIIGIWTEFHDPATLRRELFNKHFLSRTDDGRTYWKEEMPQLDEFINKYI